MMSTSMNDDGLSYLDSHDHEQSINLTLHPGLNGTSGDLYNDTAGNLTTILGPPGPKWYKSTFGVLLIVPEWEAALTAVTLSLIIILTLVGNLLVILSVFTYRPLRSAPNFFIVSLAVADMTVALLVLPLNVAYSILGRWVLGKYICEIWLTCDVLCCTASILHLCFIAIDRYKAITDPVNYARKRTVQRVLWSIVVIWVMSFLISSPPMLGWNDWPNDFKEDTPCTLTSEQGYVIYSALGSFFIPLVVMTAVYIRIFIATRRRLRQRAKASRLSAMARHKSIESKKNGGDGGERSSISSIENNGNDGSGDHCLQRSAESMNQNLATTPNSISNSNPTPNNQNANLNANSNTNSNSKSNAKSNEKKSKKGKNCLPTISKGKKDGSNSNRHANSNSEDNETARNSRGILKGRLQSQLTVDDYDGTRLGPATNISEDSVTDAEIPLNVHHHGSLPSNNANFNNSSQPNNTKHHNHHSSTREGKSRGSKKPNRQPSQQVSQFVEEKQRISLSKERKAARTLGIIMGSFVICWLPFFLMYVILPFCEDCFKPSQKLGNFITWLGYVNSFLNPVIYTIFNMDFRKAFKKLLHIGK